MASASNSLLVECRMALGLTQQEFADILGLSKRTIQRWEDHGTPLSASEAEAFAHVLLPVRPDLAAQIAAAAGTTLDRLGIVPDGSAKTMATCDPIDSVLRAAANAMGVTPDAIRPAVAAAFVRARDLGVDVQTMAEELSPSGAK